MQSLTPTLTQTILWPFDLMVSAYPGHATYDISGWVGSKVSGLVGFQKLNPHIQLCDIFAHFGADTLYATESYTLLYTLA